MGIAAKRLSGWALVVWDHGMLWRERCKAIAELHSSSLFVRKSLISESHEIQIICCGYVCGYVCGGVGGGGGNGRRSSRSSSSSGSWWCGTTIWLGACAVRPSSSCTATSVPSYTSVMVSPWEPNQRRKVWDAAVDIKGFHMP